ncbi:MAG: NAD-dependent epimerase/dehydratase family protein [Planctomycetota bacterium]
MGMRVLVTGGAGFIGSHLAEALLERGDEVLCIDNLDSYYDPSIKRRNLAALLPRPGFTFIEGDIRDRDLLDQIGKSNPLDVVVHLAARAGVRPSIREPGLYAEVNLLGTSHLLEIARQYSIRRFIFASSSSVYGERTETPFRESDRVDHPISPYAATKRGGELLCHTYHHLFGLDVACLRFFTVYGPRQRPEMAIHKFARLIDEGRPVPLYGDGSARRDFTYISDIVGGILCAIEHNQGYAIYNLGNHRMIALKELITRLAEALAVEPQIEKLPAQPGDVSVTCADIDLARRELGYHPSTSIDEGLASFVAWFRESRAGGAS